ncbi:MAG: hypothetical protein AAFR93_10340 [Pseudomonadota bacterium]
MSARIPLLAAAALSTALTTPGLAQQEVRGVIFSLGGHETCPAGEGFASVVQMSVAGLTASLVDPDAPEAGAAAPAQTLPVAQVPTEPAPQATAEAAGPAAPEPSSSQTVRPAPRALPSQATIIPDTPTGASNLVPDANGSILVIPIDQPQTQQAAQPEPEQKPTVRVRRGGFVSDSTGFGFSTLQQPEPEPEPEAGETAEGEAAEGEAADGEATADGAAAAEPEVQPSAPIEQPEAPVNKIQFQSGPRQVAVDFSFSAILCQDSQTALFSSGEWRVFSPELDVEVNLQGGVPSRRLTVPKVTYRTDGQVELGFKFRTTGDFTGVGRDTQELSMDFTALVQFEG